MRALYKIMLLIGCLTLGSYLFVRFYLEKDVKKSTAQHSTLKNNIDSTVQQPESKIDLRPLFVAKLKQVIKDGSKGLYDLLVDSVRIDVLNSSVHLLNVRLIPDDNVLSSLKQSNDAPDDVFKASFGTLRIKGVNVDDVVTRQTIDFDTILISKPSIEIFHQRKASEKKDVKMLYQRLMKSMKSISVKRLLIDEGSLVYHNPQKKGKATKIDNVAIRLSNIQIDSTTANASDRFLFAKSGVISIRNYQANTANNLYHFKIKKLTIAAPEKLMTLQGVSLAAKPRQKKKYQEEEYRFNIPSVTVHKINWWELMSGEAFTANKISINGGKLNVFLDRSLPPPKSKMGKFPTQLLAKLPMRVFVNKLEVRNLDLTYEEFNPRSKMSGKASFNNLRMTSSAITNIKEQLTTKKKTAVSATALFMNKVPLKASFEFDLNRIRDGAFSSSVSMGAFDGEVVNDLTVPLGLMKIEEGDVKKMHMQVIGDEKKANGKLSLLYNDLKVSLYEKEADEKGLDKKSAIGLLANAFVIKDDNPKNGEAVRAPEANFQRDPQTGFFNLIWKTGLVGILKTIGANPKLAKKKP